MEWLIAIVAVVTASHLLSKSNENKEDSQQDAKTNSTFAPSRWIRHQLEKIPQESEATWKGKFETHRKALKGVHDRIDALNDRKKFIRSIAYDLLVSDSKRVADNFKGKCPNKLIHLKGTMHLKAIRTFNKHHQHIRDYLNQKYIEAELVESSDLFDTLEATPLNDEQRRAIVTDDDSNLVVAAAGSGKTSVIVAKVVWLLKNNYCRPSEILLLSFARNTKRELEERIKISLSKQQIDTHVNVKTFHSLGLSIINNDSKSSVDTARSLDDNEAKKQLIQSIVNKLVMDDKFEKKLIDWFEKQFTPYKYQNDFGSIEEYYSYLKRSDLRTLQGEQVKSFEECEIANFLYLNGVKYEYEAKYKHERNYYPDFYLPEYNIFIEHFGIDENGIPPRFFSDPGKYIQDIEWKRNSHEKHKTILVESYSYEKRQGKLTSNLKDKLSNFGVVFHRIPSHMVFDQLKKLNKISPFYKLLSNFIILYKEAELTKTIIDSRVNKSTIDIHRATAFLEIFFPVYERYSSLLKERGTIDYQDMINDATKLAKKKYRSPYKYILVDEFQDISLGRSRLLQALIKNSPGTQFFAVGDDWQSIFRFTGTDTSIMLNCTNHFGPCSINKLETTHRFNQIIADLSTKFILQNKSQISKKVLSISKINETCVFVGYSEKGNIESLRNAIKMISNNLTKGNRSHSVLILGRYKIGRYNDITYGDLSALSREHPNLQLEYKTVHGSKGLEADYVVVIGMNTGKFSFPSEIQDDPLINLVSSDLESYPNAEERRLFYVALTRARHGLFLLSEVNRISPFIEEIIEENNMFIKEFGYQPNRNVLCPKCHTGKMIKRMNRKKRNFFYGCSNYPFCNGTRTCREVEQRADRAYPEDIPW